MRCCSSRAREREPHAAPTPQNLEMTDAHVRARALPCQKRLREPTLGEHATSALTWGGLLCERAHTRGKSEFLGRLIREMEASKERRPPAGRGRWGRNLPQED